MWIVVEGGLYDKYKFYGPFKTHKQATMFGDKLVEYNIVMELVNPKAQQEIANAQ